VAEGSERLDAVAAETRLSKVQLSVVYHRLNDDPAIPALWRFRSLLSGFGLAAAPPLDQSHRQPTLDEYANIG
jgi:hypothetical protein